MRNSYLKILYCYRENWMNEGFILNTVLLYRNNWVDLFDDGLILFAIHSDTTLYLRV